MTPEVTLGIDFGTTTTTVALRQPGQPPIPLPIGQDGTTAHIPSVVAFRPRPGGEVETLVGEEAVLAAGAGVIVIGSVKRCLGCAGDRCSAVGSRSPDWCAGSGLITAPGGEQKRPEDIVFLIIAEALERAVRATRESLGLDVLLQEFVVAPVNLGCTSTFDLQQRQSLQYVACQVGFEGVGLRNIIEEPIAAGISYAKLAGITGGKVLIYDFGGGTFDTAIVDVDIERGRLTILAADGVPWLGGDDIDQLVYVNFLGSIAREHGMAPEEVEERLGPADRHSLRRRCTQAKEALSDARSFEDALLSEDLGTLLLDLSRAQLEQMVLESDAGGSDLIERSLDCVLSTYRTARTFELAKKGRLLDTEGVSATTLEDMAGDIDAVILVGGVTKMPLVRTHIIDLFAEGVVVDEQVVEPITAVAIGAAYPREMDHFSLLYPPYSIQVVFSDEEGGEDEVVTLHEAYGKLDYFPWWETNTLPVYRSSAERLKRTYPHARLRFAGDGIEADDVPLSLLPRPTCDCYLTMDLAGRVQVNAMVVRGREACRVPVTHPLQEDIIRAEDERERREKEEDWRKEIDERRPTMQTEN